MTTETNRLATIAARQTRSRIADRMFALGVALVSALTAASLFVA